jgi:hypothetical protein
MSVVMFDGFDLVDQVHRYTHIAHTLSTSPVRTGTHSLELGPGGGGINYLALDAAQEDDVMYCGFGFWSGTQVTGGDVVVCEFAEGFGGVPHVSLIRRSGIRGWEIRGGTPWTTPLGGSLLVPALPNVWFPNSWHYVEFGAKIHGSTGWVEMRQDGITRMQATGIDTDFGGSDQKIDRVGWSVLTNSGNWWLDDVYILNEQGSIPALTTWLGDTRMYPLYPIGDGFYLMLVGSDADSIDNWMLVDEVGTPITSDYVFSATVGDKDTYEFSDLPVTVGTVRGIEIRVHASKSNTGTKQFRTIDRRAGADAFQPDHTLAALPLWQTHHDILEQDPHAGPGDWTIPNINATEWGVEVRS